jgi:ribosomal 50S subunit-associated protein YjgA (DUF615 family)
VQREEIAQKPPKSSRELFKLIRQITENTTENAIESTDELEELS